MRCIAKYHAETHPPLLKFYIFGAPHRRVHIAVIQKYRECLYRACKKIEIDLPIEHPIDLSVFFVDPCSPDLDNLITAVYQAMDGATLRKPSVMKDDGLISSVQMSKFYPGRKV